MGFADDLEQETRRQPCRVNLVRDKMSPDDVNAFDEALDNLDGVSNEGILRAVRRNKDLPVLGRRALKNHRDRICPCYPETS